MSCVEDVSPDFQSYKDYVQRELIYLYKFSLNKENIENLYSNLINSHTVGEVEDIARSMDSEIDILRRSDSWSEYLEYIKEPIDKLKIHREINLNYILKK
jgi:hypothetical protein